MSVSPKFLSKSINKNVSPVKKTYNKKEEFSRQITALISIELSRIDEIDIKNGINCLFLNQSKEQSTFIKGLIEKINDVKKNSINKIKEFIFQNSTFFNFNNDNTDNYIIIELKNLQKNSKIKFKQLNDCISII